MNELIIDVNCDLNIYYQLQSLAIQQIYQCPFFEENDIDVFLYNVPVFVLLTFNTFFLVWIMIVSIINNSSHISAICLKLTWTIIYSLRRQTKTKMFENFAFSQSQIYFWFLWNSSQEKNCCHLDNIQYG